MLPEESNIGKGHRVAPKYSDAEIMLHLFKAEFWKTVFQKGGIFLLITKFLQLLLFSFAFTLGAIFRRKYGIRTIGFIVFFFAVTLIISYNSTRIAIGFKPFFGFAAPVLPFVMTPESLLSLTFHEVHSTALLYFLLIFTAFGLFNVLSITLGFGNRQDATKRGNSYINLLLFKHNQRIKESFVQSVIEPLLATTAGFVFWYFLDDVVFASYLWAASLCLALQEVFDIGYQRSLKYPG